MKLAAIFSDGMVLQRNKEIRVFGEGEGDGFVEFRDTRVPFSAENGRFLATLPACAEGGPYTLSVTLGGESVTLTDVLVGDVYIAGGQSNMEVPSYETVDIFPVDCAGVRLFRKGPNSAEYASKTKSEACDRWHPCRKETSRPFSAIGLLFGVSLYEKTGVPVGIISCALGASRIDAWTPYDIVDTPEYREWVPADYRTFGDYAFNERGWCYENKLLPLCPYSVAGVLYYQGESNTKPPACYHYDELLEKMTGAWRRALGDDTLPFYIVQLPGHPSDIGNWAAVRERQERFCKKDAHARLITMPETGEAKMIHPARKSGVAKSLLGAVLADLVGSDAEYCGPIAESFELIEDGLRITFSHADGLYILGNHMTDTYVYDHRGVAATVFAEIEGNTLTLTWWKGLRTTRVSMGYGNEPYHNLYNKAGYLASPFSYTILKEEAENDQPVF